MQEQKLVDLQISETKKAVEFYTPSLQKIAEGLNDFQQAVIEKYLPKFSRLPEKYRHSYLLQPENLFSVLGELLANSEMGGGIIQLSQNLGKGIKSEILFRCPPSPNDLEEDEIREIVKDDYDALPERRRQQTIEREFSASIDKVFSGIGELDKQLGADLKKKIRDLYPFGDRQAYLDFYSGKKDQIFRLAENGAQKIAFDEEQKINTYLRQQKLDKLFAVKLTNSPWLERLIEDVYYEFSSEADRYGAFMKGVEEV